MDATDAAFGSDCSYCLYSNFSYMTGVRLDLFDLSFINICD